MRRETSRVSFLMCPFCVRGWLTKTTTDPGPGPTDIYQHPARASEGLCGGRRVRKLVMQLGDEQPFRFLIHDRDTKFSHAFDEILRTEGIRIIRTPVRAPNANAFAERWVRTVRADCLDRIFILGRRHLEHVLRVYRRHYNEHRPHRALELLPPDGGDPAPLDTVPCLHRRDLLGGLIHEYEAA
jgi:putative transposase